LHFDKPGGPNHHFLDLLTLDFVFATAGFLGFNTVLVGSFTDGLLATVTVVGITLVAKAVFIMIVAASIVSSGV